MTPELWAAVCALAVVALLIGERSGDLRVRAVSKVVASSAFLACAVAAGATGSSAGKLLLGALALSWVGDVLLVAEDKRIFLGGLIAFLLGHVAYGAMFVALGTEGRWLLGGIAAIAVILPLVGRWLLPQVTGGMKWAVLAYMIVISGMVALAAGCAGATGRPVLLGAAVLFFVSDLFVARHRFVTREFLNKGLGLPLYYAAQILFALGAAGG